MQKIFRCLASFSLLFFAHVGLANNPPPKPPAEQPCRAIEDACKKAGFKKHGNKEGQGLWKQCMSPILEGKSVLGVTVDPKDIVACQLKQSEGKK
jgi:hypothetical protein